MSLPHLLGDAAWPPPSPPYLAAAPHAVERWRRRLDARPGIKVGLVWAGEPRTLHSTRGKMDPRRAALAADMDARRSLRLAALAPLADVAGVSFVSLQKGEPATQAAEPPLGMTLMDDTAELLDFADTAALVEALDLVISVDTAVAHLAGALGRPVWLLNRYDTDWRWMLDRDDSPWYPSLRQFRQPSFGDWQTVIGQVRDALQSFAAGDREQLKPRNPGPAIGV